jgi:Tfp pilus assembly protein PilO
MIDKIRFFFEKIPVNLFLVIGLAYLMFDYSQYISDPGSDLNLKKKDFSDLEKTELNLKRKILEVKEFSKKIEAVRRNLAGLEREFDSVRSILPEKVNLALTMKSVITEAQKLGILITSIQPGLVEKKELVVQYPFELEFQGSFQQYMSLLDRIQYLNEVVMVKSFSLQAIGSVEAKYVELAGKLRLFAVEYSGTSTTSPSESPEKGG